MSLNPLYAASQAPQNAAKQLAASFPLRVFLFLLLHVPLAFILPLSGWLGALHAAAPLLYGLRAAVRRRPPQILYALAYIAGAEVLWRMVGANILWEYAKYASCAIAIAALLAEGKQRINFQKRNPWFLIFFLLLLPSIIPTFLAHDFGRLRRAISFNLSGPLALALLSFYFWRRRITFQELQRALIVLVGATIPIMVRAAHSTLSRSITFTLESNFVTSGGYGPNQVSNVLGLGALAAIILYSILSRHSLLRIIFLLLGFAFLTQGLLTFSRGGTLSFFLAALAFGLHILRVPSARIRFLLMLTSLYAISNWILLPHLNRFTEGNLLQRYSSLQTTGRLEVATADLLAFRENPLLGVGVDLADTYREQLLGHSLAAHTEYTRLLAEHGLFGLLALLLLIGLLVVHYRSARPGLHRAIVAAAAVWGLSVMAQSAMRFVAISFALSLVFISWHFDQNE